MSRELRGSRCCRGGFTLVEIAIVAAIIGLLALVALPNVLSRVPRYRLDGAVSAVTGELRVARMAAISEGRRVELEIDERDGRLTVGIDRNDNGRYEPGESSVVDLGRFKGVSVSANTPRAAMTRRGYVVCTEGYWLVRLSSMRAGEEFIYVFASGHVERSKKTLD